MEEVLCEKIPIDNKWQKLMEMTELGLMLCAIIYHLRYNINLVALGCEFLFAVELMFSVSTWWSPVEFKTYPKKLLSNRNLPRVDMFVTTADTEAEPPILTINTVLSLLAVDYPSHKLACYVSDDASSSLLLYALTQASQFARLWVPFCKKYDVQVRAPFKYFASPQSESPHHHQFHLEWSHVKDEYEALAQRIEEAASKPEYSVPKTDHKTNHPAIVKVILESKEGNDHEEEEGLPHLIYVAREKRPNYPHHYKAGAMNVLTRVSGLITNAPYMLNVDCDMFVNNPTIVLQAMCAFIGLKPQDSAFVQFPQVFYTNLKDDPFGNQFTIGFHIMGRGMGGIQGPPYNGTGCFHRRKLMYGFPIDDNANNNKDTRIGWYGNCKEYVESVERDGIVIGGANRDVLERVAGCEYEVGSGWGKQVGLGYQSITEDILTGLRIHSKGWSSVSIMPNPPGFLGTQPENGPGIMVQRKRWTTGLLQGLASSNNPILLCLREKLQFRQSLSYTWIMDWSLRALAYAFYALLPAYSVITDSNFLPKLNHPAILIFGGVFIVHHLRMIETYLSLNQSVRAWWNNHRITFIIYLTSDLFGLLSFLLEKLGVSDISFDITSKGDEEEDKSGDGAANSGRLTFDESPIFVPPTTLLLLHLNALALTLLGRRNLHIAEVFSSIWVVLCLWPFVRGLVGKGKYGIPSSTIIKSSAFAFLFVQLCNLS